MCRKNSIDEQRGRVGEMFEDEKNVEVASWDVQEAA